MEILIMKLDIIYDIKYEILKYLPRCQHCNEYGNLRSIGGKLVCFRCEDWWVEYALLNHLSYLKMRIRFLYIVKERIVKGGIDVDRKIALARRNYNESLPIILTKK